MNPPRLVLAPALLLALGCGNDARPLTPADFNNHFANTVCSAVSQACLMTATACMAAELDQLAQEDQAAVAAGRVFMPASAQKCLDDASKVYGKLKQGTVALAASDVQDLASTCDQVYRGVTVAGQVCTVDEDCVAGLICDHGKTPDSGRCGTPTVVLQGGGCANIGELCPTGSYCALVNGLWSCQAKVTLGGACDASTPCLENLRCAGAVCAAQLDIGEPCTADQDCVSGFCEPYAQKCAADVRYANGSAACVAMSGP